LADRVLVGRELRILSKTKLEWTFNGDAPMTLEADDASTRTLTRADINVVFQPIVALASGLLYGIEALVRCSRPALQKPETLFERAVKERSAGYVGRLIREVAFERCNGHSVFVNLHPAELSSRWLVRPDDPLNFHSGAVFLEVTESATFEYFGLCKGALAEVCARAGAFLVIDDFGAGYSNLKRVIDLEPSIVKLDRELITGIDKNRRQRDLVRYVVQLCEGLGARVVAEGIETVDELKALRDTGAHFGQGYLLARPAFPVPTVVWPLSPSGRRSPSRRPPAGGPGTRVRMPPTAPVVRSRAYDSGVDLPSLRPSRSSTPRPGSRAPSSKRRRKS